MGAGPGSGILYPFHNEPTWCGQGVPAGLPRAFGGPWRFPDPGYSDLPFPAALTLEVLWCLLREARKAPAAPALLPRSQPAWPVGTRADGLCPGCWDALPTGQHSGCPGACASATAYVGELASAGGEGGSGGSGGGGGAGFGSHPWHPQPAVCPTASDLPALNLPVPTSGRAVNGLTLEHLSRQTSPEDREVGSTLEKTSH